MSSEPEVVNSGAEGEAEVRELEAAVTKIEPEDGGQLPTKSNLQPLLPSLDSLTDLLDCTVCGKTGFSLAQLTKHVQFHDRDRPFPCSTCGKRFLSRSHYMEHQRVHTGDRPFHCKHCGRAFTTHHNLKRHQLIHSKEETYSCTECGVLFCQEHQQGNMSAIVRVLKQHDVGELISPDPHIDLKPDPEPADETLTKFKLQTIIKEEQNARNKQLQNQADEDTSPFAEREEKYSKLLFHPEVPQIQNSKEEFSDLVPRMRPRIQKIAYDIEIIL